jgi:hypothetical protein
MEARGGRISARIEELTARLAVEARLQPPGPDWSPDVPVNTSSGLPSIRTAAPADEGTVASATITAT